MVVDFLKGVFDTLAEGGMSERKFATKKAREAKERASKKLSKSKKFLKGKEFKTLRKNLMALEKAKLESREVLKTLTHYGLDTGEYEQLIMVNALELDEKQRMVQSEIARLVGESNGLVFDDEAPGTAANGNEAIMMDGAFSSKDWNWISARVPGLRMEIPGVGEVDLATYYNTQHMANKNAIVISQTKYGVDKNSPNFGKYWNEESGKWESIYENPQHSSEALAEFTDTNPLMGFFNQAYVNTLANMNSIAVNKEKERLQIESEERAAARQAEAFEQQKDFWFEQQDFLSAKSKEERDRQIELGVLYNNAVIKHQDAKAGFRQLVSNIDRIAKDAGGYRVYEGELTLEELRSKETKASGVILDEEHTKVYKVGDEIRIIDNALYTAAMLEVMGMPEKDFLNISNGLSKADFRTLLEGGTVSFVPEGSGIQIDSSLMLSFMDDPDVSGLGVWGTDIALWSDDRIRRDMATLENSNLVMDYIQESTDSVNFFPEGQLDPRSGQIKQTLAELTDENVQLHAAYAKSVINWLGGDGMFSEGEDGIFATNVGAWGKGELYASRPEAYTNKPSDVGSGRFDFGTSNISYLDRLAEYNGKNTQRVLREMGQKDFGILNSYDLHFENNANAMLDGWDSWDGVDND